MIKKAAKQLDIIPNKLTFCPVAFFNKKTGGKWKLIIIYHLANNKLRFGELSYRMPGISRKVLTENLKQMKSDGLIIRSAYNEVPLKVEYSLTQAARDLFPLFQELAIWAGNFTEKSKVVDCPILKRTLQNK